MTNNAILISLIIPIYNAEKYLGKCLESLAANESENVEIVLINDGSTDASDKICQEFLLADKRARYFKQTNQGVSSARNIGIENAKGKYLVFVDSDDYVSGDFAEKLESIAANDDFDIIGYRYNFVDSKGKVSNEYAWRKNYSSCADIIKELAKGPKNERVSIFSYALKRDIAIKNNLRFTVGCKYGEDQEFTHKAMSCSKSVVLLKDLLYNYRLHESNAMKKITLDQMEYVNAIKRARGYAKQRIEGKQLALSYTAQFIPYITSQLFFILISNGMSMIEIERYCAVHDIDTTLFRRYKSSKMYLLLAKIYIGNASAYRYLDKMKYVLMAIRSRLRRSIRRL